MVSDKVDHLHDHMHQDHIYNGNKKLYLQKLWITLSSQSEVSLTPRQRMGDQNMAADRFRQSLQMAANRLQSTVVRRVNPPSQPTTPTTPSTPWGSGHPLAMLNQTNGQNSSAQSTPSVIRRQDVPPSPDTIRGSKTLMKLNKALDARDNGTTTQDPLFSLFF